MQRVFVCSFWSKTENVKDRFCYNAFVTMENDMTDREYKRWKWLDEHYDDLTEEQREEHAELSTKLG